MKHPCKNCIVKACCNQQKYCEEYKNMKYIEINIILPICYLLGFGTVVFSLFIMLLTVDQEYQKYYLGCSWIISIIIGHYLIKKYNLVNSSPIFYLGPVSLGVLLGLLLAKVTHCVLIRE